MQLSLAALFFGFILTAAQAMKGIFDDTGSKEVAEKAKLKTLSVAEQEKLLKYINGYVDFHSNVNNWNKIFAGVDVPVGILCMFTIRMDKNPRENGKRRVVKLEELEREIDTPKITVEKLVNEFAYGDIDNEAEVKELKESALKIGKQYIIHDISGDNEIQGRLCNGYQSVGYVRLPLSDYGEDGYYDGDYMFFAVLYSKLEGL